MVFRLQQKSMTIYDLEQSKCTYMQSPVPKKRFAIHRCNVWFMLILLICLITSHWVIDEVNIHLAGGPVLGVYSWERVHKKGRRKTSDMCWSDHLSCVLCGTRLECGVIFSCHLQSCRQKLLSAGKLLYIVQDYGDVPSFIVRRSDLGYYTDASTRWHFCDSRATP